MTFPTILTGTDARIEAQAYACFDTANIDAPVITQEQIDADDEFWADLDDMEASAGPAFEAGAVYATRSICDHECIFRWIVTRRTAKSVWLQSVRIGDDGSFVPYGEVKRRGITSHYEGGEMVYPSGQYSMCPILTPEKKVTA